MKKNILTHLIPEHVQNPCAFFIHSIRKNIFRFNSRKNKGHPFPGIFFKIILHGFIHFTLEHVFFWLAFQIKHRQVTRKPLIKPHLLPTGKSHCISKPMMGHFVGIQTKSTPLTIYQFPFNNHRRLIFHSGIGKWNQNIGIFIKCVGANALWIKFKYIGVPRL